MLKYLQRYTKKKPMQFSPCHKKFDSKKYFNTKKILLKRKTYYVYTAHIKIIQPLREKILKRTITLRS